jgi:hypothetical protein
VLTVMKQLVATELAVVTRALRCSDRTPSGAEAAGLFTLAARALPPGPEDRVFARDVETAYEVLTRWAAAPPAAPAGV